MTPRRLLPDRQLPPYAYLPGRHPHPMRDPEGHSHRQVEVEHDPAESLRWGIDLFDQGYPWEAHEAWEPLWFAAERSSKERSLFKGLILLAAASVKIREGKSTAALRHAERSVGLLRQATGNVAERFQAAAGVSPDQLAAEIAASYCVPLRTDVSADPHSPSKTHDLKLEQLRLCRLAPLQET